MQRRAQSAVEFVVLAGIMFFVFSISIIYVEDVLVDYTQAGKEAQLMGVRDAIVAEVALADRMPAGYQRTFVLPPEIQGIDYTVTVQPEPSPNKDGFVLRSGGTEILAFLDYDVTGTLHPGTNTIRRTNTVVLN